MSVIGYINHPETLQHLLSTSTPSKGCTNGQKPLPHVGRGLIGPDTPADDENSVTLILEERYQAESLI
jgi:hypothetical protein